MRRTPLRCALVVLLGAPLAAQDDDAALARFAALGFRQKAAIVRGIEQQVAQLDSGVLARIRALAVDTETLPAADDEPPIFDPARFAETEHAAGRAPARRVVPVAAPEHRAVRERFARAPFLPDLRAEVRYDHATGRVVRGAAPGWDDLFANALHGWPPGSDQAIATILAALDDDPAMRELGAWFGHVYCDLDARAFPPVTLYDAWYSGSIVDVPDVDAIPFAWDVLGWKRYRSPLSGPPRDRLYEAIRTAALRYRIHRTQCEAAAAAFVRAEPDMDPTYALLVPRFHYLWATLGDDVAALREKLGQSDRDGMLAEVDARIREPGGAAYEVREGRKRELAELEGRIRAIALAALDRFGK